MTNSNSTTSGTAPVPQTISRRLGRLRNKLTAWILEYGVARWLLLVLVMIGFDILVDRFFKMDFAQRTIMLCLIAAVAVYFLYRWVIKPLMMRPDDDALLLAVESRNPDAGESMISSFQLERQRKQNPDQFRASGTSPQLAEQTIRHGATVAGDVDFATALDREGSGRSRVLLLAGVALSILLGWGVATQPFFKTWFSRNVMLSDARWPQSTYLEIVGVRDGRIALPMGANHRQLVRVTEDSRVSMLPVTLEIESGSSRTMHRMKANGKLDGREHEFSFYPTIGRMRATGGDATTEWIEVELVEPPTIDELTLSAVSPSYTGLEPMALVGSGQHSVLTGSALDIKVKSNKPLDVCELRLGNETFALEPVDGNLQMYQTVLGRIDEDAVDSESSGSLSGGEYEFNLVDQTGLGNIRPSRFSISIKDDLPPKVRAQKSGVSSKVVPDAVVPVDYFAADEYGLVRIFYDCSWTAAEAGDDVPPQVAEQDMPDFRAGDGGNIRTFERADRLELLDFKLEPGMVFRFSVAAIDNRPGEPNKARSDEMILSIVTLEELRADLLNREISQRRAFQEAYEGQLTLTSELGATIAMVPEDLPLSDFDGNRDARLIKFNAEREQRLITIARDQKQIGTRLETIALRFEEFLQEVKNNGLDRQGEQEVQGRTLSSRFADQIIQPIREVDTDLVSLASRNLENCRRNSGNQIELEAAGAGASQVQEQILVKMKAILDAMINSEGYQEAINKFLEIKGLEEKLQEDINDREPDVFDPDEDDIFDK